MEKLWQLSPQDFSGPRAGAGCLLLPAHRTDGWGESFSSHQSSCEAVLFLPEVSRALKPSDCRWTVSNHSPSVLPSRSPKRDWLPLRGHQSQGLTLQDGWGWSEGSLVTLPGYFPSKLLIFSG